MPRSHTRFQKQRRKKLARQRAVAKARYDARLAAEERRRGRD